MHTRDTTVSWWNVPEVPAESAHNPVTTTTVMSLASILTGSGISKVIILAALPRSGKWAAMQQLTAISMKFLGKLVHVLQEVTWSDHFQGFSLSVSDSRWCNALTRQRATGT